MKIVTQSIGVIVTTILLSGCLGMVETNTTAYHTSEIYNVNRSIAVIASTEEVDNSLEFSSFKRMFEQGFQRKGFRIADIEHSDLVAVVAYGIDSGTTTTKVDSMPIYGQTTTYDIYGNLMPTFGVVGTNVYSYDTTTYTRAVAIKVFDNSPQNSSTKTPIYEVKAVSSGTCSTISSVIPQIIESIFDNFPGDNGKSANSYKASDGSC